MNSLEIKIRNAIEQKKEFSFISKSKKKLLNKELDIKDINFVLDFYNKIHKKMSPYYSKLNSIKVLVNSFEDAKKINDYFKK